MRLRRPFVFLLILGWLLLVLYPNPSLLLRSVGNIKGPDIDTAAVHDLATSLPDDPRLIEQAVLGSIVPYAYDWGAYGVPWYFSTTVEALAAGQGDCKSRAIVFASILKAKGIRGDTITARFLLDLRLTDATTQRAAR